MDSPVLNVADFQAPLEAKFAKLIASWVYCSFLMLVSCRHILLFKPLLVGGWPTSLKNDGVRQLGWWHSQYMESHKIHAPNHQSVMSWFRSPLWLWIYRDISARNLKLLELQRNLASGHHLVVMGWGAARGKLDGLGI